MPLGLSLHEVGDTHRTMQHEVQTPTSFGDGPSVERARDYKDLKTCPHEGTNVHLNNIPRGAYSPKASEASNAAQESQKRPAKGASTAGGQRLADCIDVGLMSAAKKLPAARRAQGEGTSEASLSVKLPPQFVKNAFGQGFVVANKNYPSGSDSILKASEGDLLEIWQEESNGWCYGTHITRGKTVEGCWKKEWTRSVQIESSGTDQRNGNDKMLRKLWQRRIQQTRDSYEKGCNQSSEISKGAKSMEDELIRQEEAEALRACKKKSKKKSKVSKGEPKEESSTLACEDVQEEEVKLSEETEEATIASEPDQQHQQQKETPALTQIDGGEEGWEDCKSKKSKKKSKKDKASKEAQETKMDEVSNIEMEETNKHAEQTVLELKESDETVEDESALKITEVSATKEINKNVEQEVPDMKELTEDSDAEHEIWFGEVQKEETEPVMTVPDSASKDASPSFSASGNVMRWADLSDDSDDDMSFLDNYRIKMDSETPETETPSEPVEEVPQDDIAKESPRIISKDDSIRSDEVESLAFSEWQDVSSRKKKPPGSQAIKCSKEEGEELQRSRIGSTEWKEAQNSKSKRTAQKGGIQPSRKDGRANPQWLCTFHVGIENDSDFGVTRRLLGSRGAKLNSIREIAGVRLRLRGRGSNYAEPDTGAEAAVPLQLNLCCSSLESYDASKKRILELLENIYEAYEKHRGGPRLEPDLEENPRNGN